MVLKNFSEEQLSYRRNFCRKSLYYKHIPQVKQPYIHGRMFYIAVNGRNEVRRIIESDRVISRPGVYSQDAIANWAQFKAWFDADKSLLWNNGEHKYALDPGTLTISQTTDTSEYLIVTIADPSIREGADVTLSVAFSADGSTTDTSQNGSAFLFIEDTSGDEYPVRCNFVAGVAAEVHSFPVGSYVLTGGASGANGRRTITVLGDDQFTVFKP